MSRYIEPTQATFDSAEQAAIDLLSTRCPDVMAKTGSVVRELVIRPLAYIVAWATGNLENLRTQSSAAYLKTSQATENPIADAVASNYFIERRQGTYSRGTVALVMTDSYLRLPRGTSFEAAGVLLRTDSVVVASAGESPGMRDGVLYVTAANLGGSRYLAVIPVQAVDTGPVEIASGTAATARFGLSSLESATISSAITGGSGTETDAQLMARAESATANGGIGSFFGIKKKLDSGPVAVLSFGIAAGEDASLARARYNGVNINPGGFVDCYVKTQNQLSSMFVTAEVRQADDGVGYAAVLPVDGAEGRCHGLVAVRGPLRDAATGDAINEFSLSFSSYAPGMDGYGARLGVQQRAEVHFLADEAPEAVTAEVLYMPGLLDLQMYMDGDDNRFIGQSVMVKSAIPVYLSIDCAVSYPGELSDDQRDLLCQAIANYVNGTPVGAGKINFSSIREHCASVLDGAVLRLPCTISAATPLIGGGTDSFYSNTGILDITTPVNADWWNPDICYFSASKDSIRVSPV